MITVTLSWPSPSLWSNRTRYHWSERARDKRDAKQEAFVCTKKAMEGSGWQDPATWEQPASWIAVKITGHKPRNRRVDCDNLQAALKASLDGIAQALDVDDYRFRPVTDWGADDPPRGSVTVEIGA